VAPPTYPSFGIGSASARVRYRNAQRLVPSSPPYGAALPRRLASARPVGDPCALVPRQVAALHRVIPPKPTRGQDLALRRSYPRPRRGSADSAVVVTEDSTLRPMAKPNDSGFVRRVGGRVADDVGPQRRVPSAVPGASFVLAGLPARRRRASRPAPPALQQLALGPDDLGPGVESRLMTLDSRRI